MKKPSAAVASLLVASLCACASIRVVSATKQGGEIALLGSRESAMDKARDEMAHTCGGANAYEIVEEGEVGFQADASNADPKEWHIHYECKSATASDASASNGHDLVIHL